MEEAVNQCVNPFNIPPYFLNLSLSLSFNTLLGINIILGVKVLIQ